MTGTVLTPYYSSFNHFQKHGTEFVQNTFSEIGWRLIYVFCIDLTISVFIRAFIIGKDRDSSHQGVFLFRNLPGRWFLLHSLWNIWIVFGTWEDFLKTIEKPSDAANKDREYNLAPTFLSMALHLYHCIAPWYAKSLNFQDLVHHVGFAICGLGYMSLWYSWGPGANFAFFFLTGLPGAIDYFLLALVKWKKIHRNTEKKFNVIINNWCRGPGCVVAAAWTFVCYKEGIMDPPLFIVTAQLLLLVLNGQYYASRVTRNYQMILTSEEIRSPKTDRVKKMS